MEHLGYTDIHTHILPGMDDGAKTESDAWELLQAEYAGGVRQVVFTPHFYPERENLDQFLERRNKSYSCFLESRGDRLKEMTWKRAAEVRYSSKLSKWDLKELCVEGTPYMLMELSVHAKPVFFEEVLFQIQQQGIVPILAHAERYPYLMDDPVCMGAWIDAGILIQVNAGSLLQGGAEYRNIKKLLKRNMVHLMASDTHSAEERPPNLEAGLEQCSEEMREQLDRAAGDVFAGRPVIPPTYQMPKKIFSVWV